MVPTYLLCNISKYASDIEILITVDYMKFLKESIFDLIPI